MANKPGARPKYALLDHKSKRTCDISSSVTVGRENTDLVFPALESLSRQHFRILIEEDGAWIEDLGSSNGTRLNKAKLPPHTRQALFNGDSIVAGKAVFTFQIRGVPKNEGASNDQVVRFDNAIPAPEIKPRGPVADEDRLSPEISLVLDKPKKRKGSKMRPEEGVISMLHHHPDEDGSREKRSYGGLIHQWTTMLLLFGLGYVGYVEFTEIRASPDGGPHSVRDLLLRYLFAVGLMYATTVFLQFLFVLTFARRWYLAVLSMGLSVYLGSLLGDKLDEFAQYHKAEVENHLQASKTRSARKSVSAAARDVAGK
jgi:pSer/pThr/pTyr-binding forkhead associated (FHA) protein